MSTDRRDPVSKLVAEINGSCGPHIVAGVNGNIPDGWYAGNLSALPLQTAGPTHVVVFASAAMVDRPLWACPTIGARFEVDSVGADHLAIADELAGQLSERIKRYQRQAPPTADSIRISLADGAVMPKRASSGASGYDVRAIEGCLVAVGQIVKIRTGLHLEIPLGMEAHIRPRSGLATRGLWVHLATIDSDYRGECWVIAANVGGHAIHVSIGDRVAQMVFQRIALPELEVVDVADLTPTERGAGGLGSTGTR
jgi:dUTP pyrophosphatase